MVENWPYESREKLLEKDLEKLKNQYMQTLLNSNQVILELQSVQEQLTSVKAENAKLKTQVHKLNDTIEKLKAKKVTK